MALKAGFLIGNLETFVNGRKGMSIVLCAPNREADSLSSIFSERMPSVSADNARMTRLKDWDKSMFKQGKKYGYAEAADWKEFAANVECVLENGGYADSLIEYEGVVTHINNSFLGPDGRGILLSGLQSREPGRSLYEEDGLRVAFLTVECDERKRAIVSLPYIDGRDDDLKQVYLHKPDFGNCSLS